MEFFYNFPLFSLILCLISAVLSVICRAKAARLITLVSEAILSCLAALTLAAVIFDGAPFVYKMGHFPAPWGNEIRCGILEAMTALVFSAVLFFSVLGGSKYVSRDVSKQKVNLYYALINLIGAALTALVYTNDIFTGYVFLEILTLTSCGILMIREIGRTTLAATRYMILNLLGSGLVLMGIILLYDLSGHLLMSNMKEAIATLVAKGEYTVPMTVAGGVITLGLGLKSGLFPFHFWMPDTYGASTPTSSSILSGLVSKGYIFLLVKIYFRVLGTDNPVTEKLQSVLLVLGLAGIIFGSVSAISQKDLQSMLAFSSAAQIGYIYLGIGIGGSFGFAAAIFHIYTHALTKPLLFLSSAGMSEMTGGRSEFRYLQGAAHKDRASGFVFTVGSLSMIGIPAFAGFVSKLLFCVAACRADHAAITVASLVVLALSTLLNAMYFIRTVIRIFTPQKEQTDAKSKKEGRLPLLISLVSFATANILFGVASPVIIDAIERGLAMLS